jgi:hypothetical protein
VLLLGKKKYPVAVVSPVFVHFAPSISPTADGYLYLIIDDWCAPHPPPARSLQL